VSDAEAGKRAAALAAVALVADGMALGLGTGSTMVHVLDVLAARIRADGLSVKGVPTSERTAEQARRQGIPLTTLAETPVLDLAIDGADEIAEGTLDLVKGLGGALLREKIIQQAARRFVVVADPSKIVPRLGLRAPLPVEVVPFAHEATARHLSNLGLAPVLRTGTDGPYRTDNGNLIYDCGGVDAVADVAALQAALVAIAGVVETGLFLGCTERAIIGAADGGSTEMRPV
jgi:ribose 5-phosphate isomerase A